jgi:hypothetical protein
MNTVGQSTWLNFGGVTITDELVGSENRVLAIGKDFTLDILEQLVKEKGLRTCYLVAGESRVWQAVRFAMETPKVVRGLVMVSPREGGEFEHLLGRLHALRCPVFVVGCRDPFMEKILHRIPNSWKIEGGASPSELKEAMSNLPRVPFRFPMKRAAGLAAG